jgi:hypothetical protein
MTTSSPSIFVDVSSPSHYGRAVDVLSRRKLLTSAFWGLGLCACSIGGSSTLELAAPGTADVAKGTGGSSSTVAIDTGGSASVSIETAAAGSPGTVSRTVECTEGTDCTCPTLSVAVLGKPGKWGANRGGDSDTAFQEWLNSSSAGTAAAHVYATKPALTSEFLARYDVLILASLSADADSGPFWSFDSSEVAAFQDWVENKGGGAIALTGYSGDGSETKPSNQLLGFTGVTYKTDGAWVTCSNWTICGCAGSNTLSSWVKTDPVIANLSNNVSTIGFENGRPINVPADAHVVATGQSNSGIESVIVGKIAGKGRVLVYGDEWITYTSQWTGAGVDSSKCTDGYYPQDVFQTAQFWFNMIKWVQPRASCFRIVNDTQPVVLW